MGQGARGRLEGWLTTASNRHASQVDRDFHQAVLVFERGSAEAGAFQPSSAALNTMGIYRFINAKQQKVVEDRKVRVPLMCYQLELNPKQPEFIVTVHGEGYKFAA